MIRRMVIWYVIGLIVVAASAVAWETVRLGSPGGAILSLLVTEHDDGYD